MGPDAPVPAIAASARRTTTAIIALAAVMLTVLAFRYSGVAGPGAVEAGLQTRIIQRMAHHRDGLLAIVPLGHPSTVVATTLLLTAISLTLRRPRLAAVALLGPPLTGAATYALQSLIGRTLDGGDALPSGHTAGATSIALVGALLMLSVAGRRQPAAAILGCVAVVGVAAAMAVALVVNRLHYITDTIAGFCAAVVLVLGLALLVDTAAGRLGSRSGHPAGPTEPD